jgi:hypothetical protein
MLLLVMELLDMPLLVIIMLSVMLMPPQMLMPILMDMAKLSMLHQSAKLPLKGNAIKFLSKLLVMCQDKSVLPFLVKSALSSRFQYQDKFVMLFQDRCATQYLEKCATLLSRRFPVKSVLPPTHKQLYTPPTMWLQLHMLLLTMLLLVML